MELGEDSFTEEKLKKERYIIRRDNLRSFDKTTIQKQENENG